MKNSRLQGFTLIELMIVIAIVAILSALAFPNFRTMMLNNRLASATNNLIADLALARAESARQGKRVTLCISSNGTSCSTTGTAWEGGRITFVDETTSGTTGTVDSGERILRITEADAGSTITIVASGFTNSAGAGTTNYIQYRPNGALNSTTLGSFKICDDRTGNFGRIIDVATTGRASLTSTTGPCP